MSSKHRKDAQIRAQCEETSSVTRSSEFGQQTTGGVILKGCDSNHSVEGAIFAGGFWRADHN